MLSVESQKKLKTLKPKLAEVLTELSKIVDFTIIEGVRTPERQKELLAQGKSTTLNSKHIADPKDGLSSAVDIIVNPIKWDDSARNYYFAGFVRGYAEAKGVKLRNGSDWDGDFDVKDQTFNDLVHFELL